SLMPRPPGSALPHFGAGGNSLSANAVDLVILIDTPKWTSAARVTPPVGVGASGGRHGPHLTPFPVPRPASAGRCRARRGRRARRCLDGRRAAGVAGAARPAAVGRRHDR